MSLPRPRRRSHTVAAAIAAVGLSLSLFGLTLGACSSNNAAVDGTGTTPPDNCATSPSTGCQCAPVGGSRDCHVVLFQSGDYVSCASGTMTCGSNGQWGECAATTITSRERAPIVAATAASAIDTQSGGIHVLNLSTDAGTCNDPCDPSCSAYADTPTGIDAGVDGLVVDDSGLTTLGFDGPPPVACTGLTITPTPQTLTVTQLSPVSPATLQFVPSFVPSTCYQGTPPALWQIDRNDIATIDSNGLLTVISPLATTIKVSAYSGLFSATGATAATANVVVNVKDFAGAPTGITSPTQFAGAGSGNDGLSIIYPYDSTVLPLGLAPPVFQWSKTSATTATGVEVTLRYPADGSKFSYAAYLPELQTAPTPSLPGKPRANIDPTAWSLFEQTAAGNDAYVAIQRLEGTTTLFPEKVVKLHFATGQLKGSVLYQSYGTKLVNNFTQNGVTFGAATLAIRPGATSPTVAAGTNSSNPSGDGCRVCHSVSANGNRLVTQRFIGNDNISAMYDFTNNLQDVAFTNNNDGRFDFPALSPDGAYLFSNAGGSLAGDNEGIASGLWNVPAGTAVTVTGLPNVRAACPVFSPDGKHVAFNFWAGSATISSKAADARSLVDIDFNPTTKAFSNARIVATPGANGLSAVPTGTYPSGRIGWPTFFPSNDKLAYEYELYGNNRDGFATRSQCDCTSPASQTDEGVHGELWWIDTATSVSTRLNQANGRGTSGTSYLPPHTSYVTSSGVGNGGDETLNYEPSINPSQVGGYSWLVFTSRRAYGNIATINPFYSDPRWHDLSAQPTTKKLWVSAMDATTTSGTDPSHPAFYLPGQELLAGNSKAYYVLDACNAGAATAYGISNGTFETNGTAGWTNSGNVNVATTAHSGTYSSLVGSTLPSRDNAMSQTFNVPTTGTTNLSLWVQIVCPDNVLYDYANVLLTDNTAGGVTTVMPNTCTNAATWVNVTSGTLAAGHSYTMTVNLHDDFYPTDPSYVFVDDVQLITNGSAFAAGPGFCNSNLDCCSGSTCTLDPPPLASTPTRHCITPPTGGCVADGTACTADSQCCNFPGSRCSQQTGKCVTIPPPLTYAERDYTRDYTWTCPTNQSVVWRLFNFNTTTPFDSKVIFSASTATTQAGLASATPTAFDTALTGHNAVVQPAGDDVGLALKNAGTSSQTWMRITMQLMPSTDLHHTPSVVSWSQSFDCVDSQ